ncbi:Uncharacterised protein [Bordetella hinzii]|nr:Uncharacterised protein [Bordetella hinzii]
MANELQNATAAMPADMADYGRRSVSAMTTVLNAFESMAKGVQQARENINLVLNAAPDDRRAEGGKGSAVAPLDLKASPSSVDGGTSNPKGDTAKSAENTLDTVSKKAQDTAKDIQKALGAGLYDAVTGKFAGMGQSFLQTLTRMATDAAAAQIGKALFGDLLSGGSGKGDAGGLLGGMLTSVIGWLGFAKGGAFAGGRLIPFASGGAFTNSVVSGPVAFPMGLMGEAGPEAIMPLERGGDGSLGVRVSFPTAREGGQASVGGVEVNVYVQGDGNAATEAKGGPEGFGRGLGDVVRAYVQQELARSFRVGGLNWKANNQQLDGAY